MPTAPDLRDASRRDLVELLSETLLRRLLAPPPAPSTPPEPSPAPTAKRRPDRTEGA